jgi:hypothetical protein
MCGGGEERGGGKRRRVRREGGRKGGGGSQKGWGRKNETNQRPHTPNRVSYGRLGGARSPSFKPRCTNTPACPFQKEWEMGSQRSKKEGVWTTQVQWGAALTHAHPTAKRETGSLMTKGWRGKKKGRSKAGRMSRESGGVTREKGGGGNERTTLPLRSPSPSRPPPARPRLQCHATANRPTHHQNLLESPKGEGTQAHP